jgi:TonB family protein
MRRRKGVESSGRRAVPAAAALGLSLALHAVLLLVLLHLRLPAGGIPAPLHVSLVDAGGSGTAPGGGPAAAEPVPPREREPKPVRRHPRRARRVAAKRVEKIAKRAAAHSIEPKREPSPPPEVASRAAAGPAPASGAPAASEGDGRGRGEGRGPGAGRGSGTGNGIGSGSGNGIDLRLVCVHCPTPAYPRRAVARGAEGTVDVWFSLRPDGTVKKATVRRSSGDRDLDGAALEVARRSRFRIPAALGSAEARGFIAYHFKLARRADGMP